MDGSEERKETDGHYRVRERPFDVLNRKAKVTTVLAQLSSAMLDKMK
jgi:hypothetical protein